MRSSLPFQSGPRQPTPRPFPTRGSPAGWRDPWDVDPYDTVVATLRQRNALRREVIEAEVRLELMAQVRADGRWEAYVVSGDGSVASWPSVNAPTAAVALDALEAELHELLHDTSALPEQPSAN
jgi:hypothetical protein